MDNLSIEEQKELVSFKASSGRTYYYKHISSISISESYIIYDGSKIKVDNDTTVIHEIDSGKIKYEMYCACMTKANYEDTIIPLAEELIQKTLDSKITELVSVMEQSSMNLTNSEILIQKELKLIQQHNEHYSGLIKTDFPQVVSAGVDNLNKSVAKYNTQIENILNQLKRDTSFNVDIQDKLKGLLKTLEILVDEDVQ